jgi:hypothetical protein
VVLGSTTTGCAEDSVAAAGAHEASKTASRTRAGRRRVLIFISFRKFITGNPYEKITPLKCDAPTWARIFVTLTVVKSYAILD